MSETKEIPYKIYLDENEMPTKWYNMRADMKNKPAPLLNPGTMQPVKPEEIEPVFCKELVAQELDNTDPYIDIPQEIQDFYKMYRPSPLVRAYCLEKKLGTPAKIYYKFEGNNTSGSHKLNSAIAQAYYAKKQGLKGVTTETGAFNGMLILRTGLQGIHGKVFIRTETIQTRSYAHVRSERDTVTFYDNRSRKADTEGTSRNYRESWMRYLRSCRDGNKIGRLSLCSRKCS